jgi:5-methylcytosine-specific restriction endonuclease McrA
VSRRYRDADWLREAYHEREWTQAEIADECGVSPRCIRDWMDRHGIDTRDPVGEHHGLYGEPRDEETRAKIAESLSGREFSDAVRTRMSRAHRGNDIDEDTRAEISASLRGRERDESTRERMSQSSSGAHNANWKGGYSRRYGSGWSTARERVLQRDEVCQHCGHDGSESRLEVHHIVPIRVFHECDEVSVSDAHAEANLVVLCKSCHPRADHGDLEFVPPLDELPDPIGEIYT